MAILLSPLGSQVIQISGAGLKRCPLRQQAFDEGPMPTFGKFDAGTRVKVPPLPPHWTKPLSGLAVFPMFCCREPSLGSKTGSLAVTKVLGSKLNACL